MKKLLALLLIVFSCQFTFAADDGDFWLQRQITIGDGKNAYGKKVYGQAARSVSENVPLKDGTGSRVEQLIKRSIAVDKPTATKVGKQMFSRLYSPQAVVGVAAVTSLLSAIGWVMEEGIWVKKVEPEDEPENLPKVWVHTSNMKKYYSSANAACSAQVSGSTWTHTRTVMTALDSANCYAAPPWSPDKDMVSTGVSRINNPDYVPKPLEPTVHPLTAALLGALMMGKGYEDPDPKFDNDRVNTGDYTSVAEVYEHDPSGVGDELADDMDDKLKNAKPTDDGKSSYIGDPKYDDVPLSDDRDDSSDRGWDEKGDEATGGTEPEKDPETGEATGNQSITLKFPLFCSWASKMCLWYDDWKTSDKVYKDHMKKTEEHQGAEKTFWGSVKGWFDWTKEEKELQDEELEVEEKEIISYVRENHVQFGQTCPFTPQMQSLSMGILGSMDFETDLTFICDFGHQANPYVLGLGHLAALIFLLIGLRNGNA